MAGFGRLAEMCAGRLLAVLHPNRVRPHKEPLHHQRRLEAARRLSFTKGKKTPSFGPNTWIARKTTKQTTIDIYSIQFFFSNAWNFKADASHHLELLE